MTTTIERIATTAKERVDWDLAANAYLQCVGFVSDEGAYLPDIAASFLAEAMTRLAVNYDSQEEQLISDTLAVWGMTEGRSGRPSDVFAELYLDERYQAISAYDASSGAGRRRPTPFEAVVETARRLRDLDEVRKCLIDQQTAGILAGSVSYGSFFNVTGAAHGARASDLDILVVIPGFDDLQRLSGSLEHLKGAEGASASLFSNRAKSFLRERAYPDEHVVFSGKIDMWTDIEDPLLKHTQILGAYLASFHFVTLAGLSYLLASDSSHLSWTSSGPTRLVRDYREQRPTREDHQRNFSGKNIRLSISVKEAPGGYERQSHAYYIDDEDRYYPGMFQNLVLPYFHLRWNSVGNAVPRKLDSFHWKIIERMRYERRQRPYELMLTSLSHTRSQMFAPHITWMADSESIFPV
ncbi:hypothetical protein [Streptomyces sp. NPDC047042]|uniref:hypothetical protein n=1 Tax=Streptomyces sp. NPDC047042 TaxID=3154807 RepID=UPI0033F91F58